MKTNKSFTKRLRVTRTGKVIGRVSGQDHFNAKESGQKQLARNRSLPVKFSKKVSQRFLPNH